MDALIKLKKIITTIPILWGVATFAKDELIFAIDIARHGDRTPQLVIPEAPYPKEVGAGQLTARGMQQGFELGSLLRKKYVYQYGLLPEHYKSGTMQVFSTSSDRTLMSAESIVFGLYPPGTGPYLSESKKPALPGAYQPIPIHTKPVDKTNSDERAYQIVSQYIFSRADWQDKTLKLKSNFKKWSLATGLELVKLEQLIALGDTLKIYELHNVSWPSKPRVTGSNPVEHANKTKAYSQIT